MPGTVQGPKGHTVIKTDKVPILMKLKYPNGRATHTHHLGLHHSGLHHSATLLDVEVMCLSVHSYSMAGLKLLSRNQPVMGFPRGHGPGSPCAEESVLDSSLANPVAGLQPLFSPLFPSLLLLPCKE